MWRIYTLCPFSGHKKNTDGRGVWLNISLANACYSDSRVAKRLLRPNSVFQPIWEWGDLGSFQLSQIPLQKEPEILVGMFSPTSR
jgi:hypothetical protein